MKKNTRDHMDDVARWISSGYCDCGSTLCVERNDIELFFYCSLPSCDFYFSIYQKDRKSTNRNCQSFRKVVGSRKMGITYLPVFTAVSNSLFTVLLFTEFSVTNKIKILQFSKACIISSTQLEPMGIPWSYQRLNPCSCNHCNCSWTLPLSLCE